MKEKKFKIDFQAMGMAITAIFMLGILTGMTLIVVLMKMFV